MYMQKVILIQKYNLCAYSVEIKLFRISINNNSHKSLVQIHIEIRKFARIFRQLNSKN